MRYTLEFNNYIGVKWKTFCATIASLPKQSNPKQMKAIQFNHRNKRNGNFFTFSVCRHLYIIYMYIYPRDYTHSLARVNIASK